MSAVNEDRPTVGRVTDVPDPARDSWLRAVEIDGYPISGDAIARHLDDPSADRSTRRYPIGDLLWPMVRKDPPIEW